MTERPKALPQASRMLPNAVKTARHEQKKERWTGIQQALRYLADQMIGSGASFLDHFFAAGGNERRYGKNYRRGIARSTRGDAQIIGELRAFYRRRPRPWRWHGNRPRARHAAGPINYDRLSRKAAAQ